MPLDATKHTTESATECAALNASINTTLYTTECAAVHATIRPTNFTTVRTAQRTAKHVSIVSAIVSTVDATECAA